MLTSVVLIGCAAPRQNVVDAPRAEISGEEYALVGIDDLSWEISQHGETTILNEHVATIGSYWRPPPTMEILGRCTQLFNHDRDFGMARALRDFPDSLNFPRVTRASLGLVSDRSSKPGVIVTALLARA